MSEISPKLIDIDGNRIGNYIESGRDRKNSIGNINILNSKYNIKNKKIGRFPTQLFTNIKKDRYKYVRNIT